MITKNGYVFISYSNKDDNKTKELQKYLEEKGYKCWRAPDSLNLRGTQDYSSDIFEAIRNCCCLLFVLSDNSLCSDWARKEVKYALERCHKPIIPYMVSRIPFVKYDTDELMISLSLQKQLLNANQSGDMSVILPYVQAYIGDGENLEEDAKKNRMPKSSEQKVNAGDILRWVSEANVNITRINELEHINFLECGDDYPFGLRRKEINEKVIVAVRRLLKAFISIAQEVGAWDMKFIDDILCKLYKLTYEYGDELFTSEIFSLVESYAKNEEPWACFVLHEKFFRSTENKSDELAYKMLSCAIRDNDNPFAAINMGKCYQWGVGCDISGRTAKFWYERALEKDCYEAYLWLGILFEYGTWDIKPDLGKAEEYYRWGIERDVQSCYYPLGLLKLETVSNDAAGKIFLEGCKKGNEQSLSVLAGSAFFTFVKTENVSHKSLEWRASCVNCPVFRRYQANVSLNSLNSSKVSEDSEKKEDSAFDHLVSGITQKESNCYNLMGDLMVFEVLKRPKGSIGYPSSDDILEVLHDCWSFFEEELKNSEDKQSRFVKLAIDVYKSEYDADYDKLQRRVSNLCNYYDNEFIQGSPFWKALTDPISDDNNLDFFSKLPSHCAGFHYLTPYRFIIALRRCPARPNSELEKVLKIWKLLRTIDYEWIDCEQIRKGHGICLTTGSAETSLDRVRRIANIFSELSNLIAMPNKYSELVSKLKEKEKELEISLSFVSDLDAWIQSVLESGMKIIEDLKDSNIVQVAYSLTQAERRYSDPQLDIALNCYRSSYMMGNGSWSALKLATLFFVHNGRFREDAVNESVIYSIKDALFKAIYLREWKAVPLFLETALFGESTGAANIEADYQAINNADPVIASMLQEEDPVDDKDALIMKIKIALAMAKIYMDESLCSSSRKEQKWGISTLLDRMKAVFWLILARKVFFRITEMEKGNEVILGDEFWKIVNQKINKLSENGYVVSGVASVFEMHGKFSEMRYSISRMGEIVKSELMPLKDKLEFYPHVLLGDRLADLAAATEETALLMKMAIKGTDNAWSLGDDLVFLREELLKSEPDSKVAIGIVCHQEDYDSICKSMEDTIDKHDLHVFKLGNLYDDVVKIFVDLGGFSENDVHDDQSVDDEVLDEEVVDDEVLDDEVLDDEVLDDEVLDDEVDGDEHKEQ